MTRRSRRVYLPLPKVVSLPLAFELPPLVSLLEPVEPVPDEPVVPELVPEGDSPDPPEVSEVPEPSVLVLPEGERDVLPLRPCDRELFPELLEPLLLCGE